MKLTTTLTTHCKPTESVGTRATISSADGSRLQPYPHLQGFRGPRPHVGPRTFFRTVQRLPPKPARPILEPMTEITARLSTALADRYKIERHLGEGGMATVYLAEDLKHTAREA